MTHSILKSSKKGDLRKRILFQLEEDRFPAGLYSSQRLCNNDIAECILHDAGLKRDLQSCSCNIIEFRS